MFRALLNCRLWDFSCALVKVQQCEPHQSKTYSFHCCLEYSDLEAHWYSVWFPYTPKFASGWPSLDLAIFCAWNQCIQLALLACNALPMCMIMNTTNTTWSFLRVSRKKTNLFWLKHQMIWTRKCCHTQGQSAKKAKRSTEMKTRFSQLDIDNIIFVWLEQYAKFLVLMIHSVRTTADLTREGYFKIRLNVTRRSFLMVDRKSIN